MNNGQAITGRLAPSPSGQLHMGNLASCLLAWLDIRALGGQLLFRMEDLDPQRSKPEFAHGIADSLAGLGLGWDFGYPEAAFTQSARSKKYNDAFNMLLRKNLVYPCYCSRSERLAASAPHMGDTRESAGCRCRYLTASQRRHLEAEGKKCAWRIKAPDREIEFRDLHYGVFREKLSDAGDFIIRRSDGVFAYQLACAYDDADMGVTRVVRGRDLLSSTARQIWLISELGGAPPQYIHAPLLVGEGGRKLSKRYGDLSTPELLARHSPEEIIGRLAGLLGLGDGSPTAAEALLDGFDWSRVPKDDIIIEPPV